MTSTTVLTVHFTPTRNFNKLCFIPGKQTSVMAERPRPFKTTNQPPPRAAGPRAAGRRSLWLCRYFLCAVSWTRRKIFLYPTTPNQILGLFFCN